MSINETRHFKELNFVFASKYTLPLVGVQRKVMLSHRSFTGTKIWETSVQYSITEFPNRFKAVRTPKSGTEDVTQNKYGRTSHNSGSATTTYVSWKYFTSRLQKNAS